MEEAQDQVTGFRIFNYIFSGVLSLILILVSILYFQEITFTFHPAFGWLILILAIIILLYSIIQLFRFLPIWIKAQSTTAIVLASLIFLVSVILIIALGNPFSLLLEKQFAHTQSQISGGNLSAYLGLDSSEITPEQIESRIHELINEERVNQNLNTLSYDSVLANIARAHSSDMVKRNYFAHDSPEGLNAIDRGNLAGYPCKKQKGRVISEGIAENLALTPIGNSEECGKVYTVEHISTCTVSGWMNSPPHRKNILIADYETEGIGIIQKENEFYITQNFC